MWWDVNDFWFGFYFGGFCVYDFVICKEFDGNSCSCNGSGSDCGWNWCDDSYFDYFCFFYFYMCNWWFICCFFIFSCLGCLRSSENDWVYELDEVNCNCVL